MSNRYYQRIIYGSNMIVMLSHTYHPLDHIWGIRYGSRDVTTTPATRRCIPTRQMSPIPFHLFHSPKCIGWILPLLQQQRMVMMMMTIRPTIITNIGGPNRYGFIFVYQKSYPIIVHHIVSPITYDKYESIGMNDDTNQSLKQEPQQQQQQQ